MPSATRELLTGPFGRLVAARTISTIGTGLGPVALAFGILDLPHGSATLLSVVQGAYLLPLVLFVLLAGAIGDRRPRLRLLVISDATSGLAWAGLAALIGIRHAPAAALIALALVGGAGIALLGPTMSGVVPELAPPGKLQQANAVMRLSLNSARVLGIAGAGVMVATVGAAWAIAANALSFFACAGLVATLGPGRPVPPSSTRMLQDLKTGAKEFFGRQWLWVVVVQFSLVVAVTQASIGVLGPLVAKRYLGGAPAWAAIVVADAVGTFAGAGLAFRVRPKRPLLVATVATSGFALPLLMLGLPVPLAVIVVAAFLSGFASDLFSILWDTTVQREIPPELLSRVSSYDFLGSLSLAPIGVAVAGPIAVAIGPRHAELAAAAVTFAACLLALLSPQVRGLRAPERSEKQAEPAPT